MNRFGFVTAGADATFKLLGGNAFGYADGTHNFFGAASGIKFFNSVGDTVWGYWASAQLNIGKQVAAPIATWGTLQITTKETGDKQYRAIIMADNATNSTAKGGMLMGAPYTNTDKPFTGFGVYSTNIEKAAYFGGG